MKEVVQLIKDFEKRNNFSIVLHLHSDGSAHVEEFWKDTVIFRCDSTDQLENYLKTEQYEFDELGLAIEKPLINLSKGIEEE
jgi:hypothetical protein